MATPYLNKFPQEILLCFGRLLVTLGTDNKVHKVTGDGNSGISRIRKGLLSYLV